MTKRSPYCPAGASGKTETLKSSANSSTKRVLPFSFEVLVRIFFTRRSVLIADINAALFLLFLKSMTKR